MTQSDPGPLLQELLDGEPVRKAPMTPDHADCVVRLHALIESAVGDRGRVQMHLPVVLDDRSEPRPDIAVLPPAGSDALPKVLLVLEVTDSSHALIYSRGRKAAYYARSGVPDCWIVDLSARQILVHSAPASSGYKEIKNMRDGAQLDVTSLAGVSIQAAEILAE